MQASLRTTFYNIFQFLLHTALRYPCKANTFLQNLPVFVQYYQCCGAEIIYFWLWLLFGSTFVYNFGSSSSSSSGSSSSPSPVLPLKKWEIFWFNNNIKLYINSNIIRSISERWLEVSFYSYSDSQHPPNAQHYSNIPKNLY